MARTVKACAFSVFTLTLLLSGSGNADIYVHRDARGVLHFTNVPSHRGFQAVIRETDEPNSVSSQKGLLEKIIGRVADRHNLDANLIRAVIKVESDFDSQAVSPKGAQGLMQLMPETARLYRIRNVHDPWENIEGGVRHLKFLLERFRGDLRLSLAAYNAGIRAVEKYGGIPPFAETRNYVTRVLRHYNRYAANGL